MRTTAGFFFTLLAAAALAEPVLVRPLVDFTGGLVVTPVRLTSGVFEELEAAAG